MDDVHACKPDWRKAQTYLPLLGADPSVWAWEFARRGLDAKAVNGAAPSSAGGAPELCFVGEGPPGDPLPTALWRWQADGAVAVLSAQPASAGDPAAMDLVRCGAPALVARTADGEQHVLISDGLRRLRLAVVEGDVLAGPVVFRFHLPALGGGQGALDNLRRLMALRDTGGLGGGRDRPLAKASRWLQVLRVHDARQAGATHRDIALFLFGETRVCEDWSAGSDYMRMRVQRLVRAAEQTVAGGYRALFGLRATGLQPPGLVEVWRSPAWLGGRLAGLFCALTFLGTSFSPTFSWHDPCRSSGAACQKSVEPSRNMARAALTPKNCRSPQAREGGVDSSLAT